MALAKKMNRWKAVLGAACVLFPAILHVRHAGAASAAAQSRAVFVDVQERGQRFLSLQAMPSRVAIGDPEVADVQVLDAEPGRQAGLMLFGNRPGSTQLQVWFDGRGAPHTWTVRVQGQMERALQESGHALQAGVYAGAGHAVVTGESASLLEHRKAVEVAAGIAGRDGVVDLGMVTTSSMVQVEVKVVELARSVMKEAGIDWRAGRGIGRSGAGAQTWAGGASLRPENALLNGFSLFYRSADFLASLALLESNGMGRVLAEPTLVAMSGQSASFLAGGEIPVPVASAQGTQTIEYKPFGIGLTVSPTVLGADRIALKVAPEASELDYNSAIPVISGSQTAVMPAIRTRRADTTIELGDGESFVISGLVSRQTEANVSKFPFLGDLPIIGAFFRSVNYSQEDRELVIVVTPRLVRPFAKGAAIPLPGARQEVADTAGNAWGHFLLGPDMGHQMPGFSR